MRDAVNPVTPLVGTIVRDITWGDCDPAGIIYYPTYFRWVDAGTWNLFFLAGLTPAKMRSEHAGMDMPAVNANLEFRNPAPFGSRAEIRSFIEHWGGKSFRVRHELTRDDGALLAVGSETRVWTKMDAEAGMRGTRIPDILRQRFFVPA